MGIKFSAELGPKEFVALEEWGKDWQEK